MSYDLMVFDPQVAPSDREGFMEWYGHQTEWQEDHKYDNPDVSTPALRAWFLDMIKLYPAMNGPFASDDVDNPKITDYSVGRSVIYAAFSWSEAEQARNTMFTLAEKHKVGFFDVSEDNGGVWLPKADGTYVCVHGAGVQMSGGATDSKRKWWQFWKTN